GRYYQRVRKTNFCIMAGKKWLHQLYQCNGSKTMSHALPKCKYRRLPFLLPPLSRMVRSNGMRQRWCWLKLAEVEKPASALATPIRQRQNLFTISWPISLPGEAHSPSAVAG